MAATVLARRECGLGVDTCLTTGTSMTNHNFDSHNEEPPMLDNWKIADLLDGHNVGKLHMLDDWNIDDAHLFRIPSRRSNWSSQYSFLSSPGRLTFLWMRSSLKRRALRCPVQSSVIASRDLSSKGRTARRNTRYCRRRARSRQSSASWHPHQCVLHQ